MQAVSPVKAKQPLSPVCEKAAVQWYPVEKGIAILKMLG